MRQFCRPGTGDRAAAAVAGVVAALVLLLTAGPAGPARAADEATVPAKDLFGAAAWPSGSTEPRAVGGYAKGCLAGAWALPADGPGWQVMRPSRNRAWGHRRLVDFVGHLAGALTAEGWPGLLVGDLAQPRGGPMRTGHASHQVGLDVDLWLRPMPERRLRPDEREGLSAASVLRPGTLEVDPARFGPFQAAAIRRSATFPEVARVFVHPGIKRALCAASGPAGRDWLAKVRPWWGHDDHFHVRLHCPAGEPLCRGQERPPEGDGCGAELDWWFTDEPWRPRDPAEPPPRPVTLAELPAACRGVLGAP